MDRSSSSSSRGCTEARSRDRSKYAGPRVERLLTVGLLLMGAWFASGVSRASETPDPAASAIDGRAGERPRSVLFYLVDTCRNDRMGFTGYGRETTPFLEWIAERAVTFDACYAQAPWTKPSMASILTSRYPSSTGVYKMTQRLPQKFETLPEVLRENGLYTAGFSANIVMGNYMSDFAQGFDHFVESLDINFGDPIRFASGSAKRINEKAFPWLDANDHWPMFLYLHSVDPHEEYEPEPEYLARFAKPERHPRYREEWQKLLKSRPPIPGLYVTQDNFDRTGIDSSSWIEHGSDLYDADIRANDDELRRLWDKLATDGWGEDFIFVFTSDHGEEFFDHGGTCHGYNLYEEMIRVPLMIWAPGLLPEGVRIDAPVRSLDIYPTVCDLLGIEPPDSIEGRSLLPVIEGSEVEERVAIAEHREESVMRQMGHGSGVLVSVRKGRWKLILNHKGSQFFDKPRLELYDLKVDPGETSNVAASHPERVRELEREAIAFVAQRREGVSLVDWAKDSATRAAVRGMLANSASPSARANASPEGTNGSEAPSREIRDAKVLAQLRALGYIGEEEEDEPSKEKEADPEILARAMWSAIRAGDGGGVRKALEAGADPNTPEANFGVIPLSMAAMRGDASMTRALLDAGAGVNARNGDGSSPLLSAAFAGHAEVFAMLLEAGADRTAKNLQGQGVAEVVQVPWELTKAVAGLVGLTYERQALEKGRSECLRLLEEPRSRSGRGPRPGGGRFRPDPRWTPLFTAAWAGNVEELERALAAGADPNETSGPWGTALHAAVLSGSSYAVERLVDAGGNPSARDRGGSTPLHLAAFAGRVEAVKPLLEAGADTEARDAGGSRPIDLARRPWGAAESALTLLGVRVNVDRLEQDRAAIANLLEP